MAYIGDDTGLPVVVDFFSQSCGPCHMIAWINDAAPPLILSRINDAAPHRSYYLGAT